MVEELGSILRNGLDTWKKNLTICLPFAFSFILTSVVAVIIIGGAILVTVGPLLPSLVPYLTDSGEIPPEVIQQLLPQFLQHIDVIIAAVIITIILVLLINAFFTAGAIGMAKAAMEKGRTSLSDMIDYGRRKFISLLFATIIVGLIALAGVVFMIPGVISLLPAITSKTPPGVTNMAAFALLFLGFVIMLFYMLIVSIILALPPYAVVIDDLGAIEGVKRGFKYFMAHKLDVFLLWLILLVIAIVAGIILGTIPYIGQWLSLAVSIVIIQPLSAIWWSRLYLSMREPTGF